MKKVATNFCTTVPVWMQSLYSDSTSAASISPKGDGDGNTVVLPIVTVEAVDGVGLAWKQSRNLSFMILMNNNY